MNWSVSQSLVLVAVVQEIGILDFVKISQTLNSMFSTRDFLPEYCEVEYNRISQSRKLQVKHVISYLNSQRISELKELLQKTRVKEDVKRLDIPTVTQVLLEDKDDIHFGEDDEMDIVETPRKSARFVKDDDKLRKWKSSCMLVFNKITDHKNGNVFLRMIREKEYEKCIKVPMYLDLVRARIRTGSIRSTSELHRDLSLICANAVMYNQEGSDIYNMAVEFKEFIDSEMQLLASIDFE